MSSDLPPLPKDWAYVPLDTCSQQNSITYGVVQPGRALNIGKPLIRVNNFRDRHLDLSDVMYIAPEVEAKYSRTRLAGGEILLTVVGSVGQVVVVPRHLAGFNVARAVAVIHPLPHIEPDWIAICLRSPLSQRLLGSRANTTVQTTINLKDLRTLPIPLPPATERRGIASFLGALDDRITLLRETNATLEAIAQALFKSWFVDFDPVRAKTEGREPEGMDAASAALFPAEFEESALGLIPQGWGAGDIYQVADVRYGAPFSSKLFNAEGDGLPLVRIRDLKDEAPGVWTAETHPKGGKIHPGDILVGMDGEFRAYLWGGEVAWMNQRICMFTPKNGHSAVFVRSAVALPLAHLEATETATTVIHLGKADIDSFRIVVPTQEVGHAFGALTQPLYDGIVANKQTMRSLTSLRDTLLPRLISGQLRLPEAQVQIDRALA